MEEKEAARDRTYEEFLEMFKDHIEGNRSAEERVGNRPGTAEAREEREEAAAKERTTESVEGSRKYQSIGSQGQASASESKRSSKRGDKTDPKYDIPKTCYLRMPAKQVVRELDDGFVLLAHPYPQLEGEMLLVQLN